MQTDRPMVFLAFADSRGDLSSLKLEEWSLRDQFDELKRRGVAADDVAEEQASLERIFSVFQKYRDWDALFHFGGMPTGIAYSCSRPSSRARLRARYATGTAARTQTGLP